MHLAGLLPIPLRSGYRTVRLQFQKSVLGKNLPDPFYPQTHERKAVFIHIPKTAGNSVTTLLYNCRSRDFGGHAYASKYRTYSLRIFRKYFFFSFVRNPYDRLYSSYRFLRQGGIKQFDQAFCDQHIGNKSFEEFVLSIQKTPEMATFIHFHPQYLFLCDDFNRIIVDYVGRFERFDEDMQKICKHIGVSYKETQINVTSGEKQEFQDAYSQKMRNIVANVYDNDFALFDYER